MLTHYRSQKHEYPELTYLSAIIACISGIVGGFVFLIIMYLK